MRYKAVFSMLLSLFLGTAHANWAKISEVDYTWGPFNIYHITLFTETGEYTEGVRPLMLTLQYKKPWEGRDFAVSLARSWKNLDLKLPEKEADAIITNLRKTFPSIRPEDTLHYIALEDRGYFILNDKVVSETFNKVFSDAIVAIWLDPKMDISRQLLDPSYKPDPQSVEKPIEQQVFEEQQAAIKQEAELKNGDGKAKAEASAIAEQEGAGQPVSAQSEMKAEAQTHKEQTETASSGTESPKNKESEAGNKGNKIESKDEIKTIKIENPEIFISPVYDDILMLSKNYS